MNQNQNSNNTSGAVAPAATCSALWRYLGDNGWRAEHDEGDFEGAIVTTAQVVQGGNGRWTPWFIQTSKGRMAKNCNKRIAGKMKRHDCPGQFATKEQAFDWAERTWAEAFSQNEKLCNAKERQ